MAAERIERDRKSTRQQPSSVIGFQSRSPAASEASEPEDIYQRDARLLRGNAMVETRVR